MAIKFRLVFLIAALVSFGLCLLAFLNVFGLLYWGIGNAFVLGIPWGIAFLLAWLVLEVLDTWARLKSSPLQCPHCEHSLRGPKCPECGERIDSPSDAD